MQEPEHLTQDRGQAHPGIKMPAIAAGASEGPYVPRALCNAKLSGSSQYRKALNRRSPGHLARLLVLRVPHFIASHTNTGGRALRGAGFLSYTRIQAGFGETSPTQCLQIHQVKFPHTAGRLAGWWGLVMSFTPTPHSACWGYINQMERMQAHLEGAPWPAQGCHLELSDALLFVPVTQKQGPFVPSVICCATMTRQSV